jgi:hypothetical protein
MGSMDIPNMECVDRILKEQVDGESPALHNACFSVIGKEGKYNCLNQSRNGGSTITNDS